MAADEYRQRAFEAQQCAAQATESSVKHGWQLLVRQWLALAEHVDRFERRYGSLVATRSEKWHVGRERLWKVAAPRRVEVIEPTVVEPPAQVH